MVRRAVILISALLLLCVGLGAICDAKQMHTAKRYLFMTDQIREMTEAGQLKRAEGEERYMSALWQRDKSWLTCLISHEEIRRADEGLNSLHTALSHGWQGEALFALDELSAAFEEMKSGHLPTWDNII